MNRKARASKEVLRLQEKYDYLMQAPVDIERLSRDLKVNVFDNFFPEDSDISAILIKKDASAAIAVNKEHPDTRKRFSIVHELGHWALHSDGEKLDVAKGNLIFLRSDSRHSLDETEANHFAAELLMPCKLITESFSRLLDANEDSFISELSKEFEVSESAITFRLMNLGLLEDF